MMGPDHHNFRPGIAKLIHALEYAIEQTHAYVIQGLLLLEEIPSTLSDEARELCKTARDTPALPRPVEDGETALAANEDATACLQLLKQILCQALFALTWNQ